MFARDQYLKVRFGQVGTVWTEKALGRPRLASHQASEHRAIQKRIQMATQCRPVLHQSVGTINGSSRFTRACRAQQRCPETFEGCLDITACFHHFAQTAPRGGWRSRNPTHVSLRVPGKGSIRTSKSNIPTCVASAASCTVDCSCKVRYMPINLTESFQKLLSKESTLHCNQNTYMIAGLLSLVKGFWKPWVVLEQLKPSPETVLTKIFSSAA